MRIAMQPSLRNSEYPSSLASAGDTPDPQYHAQYAEQIRNCVRDLGVE